MTERLETPIKFKVKNNGIKKCRQIRIWSSTPENQKKSNVISIKKTGIKYIFIYNCCHLMADSGINFNVIPLYANNKKDLQDGVISISGTHRVVRQWHKMLIGKNYVDVMNIIKNALEKNPECKYRIMKVDEVEFPGCEKDEKLVDKNRINLVLETSAIFKNDTIQKQKRINTWLAVPGNQKNVRVIGVEIY